MPIYEYRCGSCGHQLDALQKISDEHLTDCPACGESALRRLVSAPSFRLKGGGWYETDFKKDQDRKRNLADSGDGKPASGGEGAASGGGDAASKGEGARTDGAKSDTGKADTGKKDAVKKDAGKSDRPPKSGSSEAVA